MQTACQRVDVGESAVADTLLLRWTTAQINGVFWPNKVQTFRETVSKDPHDYKYIIFPSGSAICRLVRTSCWSPQYGLLTASERCFKTSERARKAWKMQHSDKFLRKQMTEVSVRDASAFISKNRLVRKLVHHQNAAYAQTPANLWRCFKKKAPPVAFHNLVSYCQIETSKTKNRLFIDYFNIFRCLYLTITLWECFSNCHWQGWSTSSNPPICFLSTRSTPSSILFIHKVQGVS